MSDDQLIKKYHKIYVDELKDNKLETEGLLLMDVLKRVVLEEKLSYHELSKLLEKIYLKIKSSFSIQRPHLEASYKIFWSFFSVADKFDKLKNYVDQSEKIKENISKFALDFMKHGSTILVKDYSPLIIYTLKSALSLQRKFRLVVVTDYIHETKRTDRPTAIHMLDELQRYDQYIELVSISYSQIGMWMSSINFILIGTDVALRDGSIVASVGTYPLCAMAQLHKCPVYVLVETYRCLNQLLLSSENLQSLVSPDPKGNLYDYTPAEYITYLISENGPIPPSALIISLTDIFGLD